MATRNRATQRRTPEDASKPVSVQEYFFRKLSDDSLELRQDVVTRGELWGALEWNFKKTVELNKWWKVLGRLIRGKTAYLNPFQLIYVARVVKKTGKELVGSKAEVEAIEAERPSKLAAKKIDVMGNVVDADADPLAQVK